MYHSTWSDYALRDFQQFLRWSRSALPSTLLACGPVACGSEVIRAESDAVISELAPGTVLEYDVQLRRGGWDDGAPLVSSSVYFCSDVVEPPSAPVTMELDCYDTQTVVVDPRESDPDQARDGCGLRLVETYTIGSDLTRLDGCVVTTSLSDDAEAPATAVFEWHAVASLRFGSDDIDVDLGFSITQRE